MKQEDTNPSPSSFEYLAAACDIRPFRQPATKLVLVTITRHRNSKTGLCCPSVVRLMALTGFSKRTILRALTDLKKSGILTRQKGWGNGHAKGIPNRYTLSLSKIKGLTLASGTQTLSDDESAMDGDESAMDANESATHTPSKSMKVPFTTDESATTAPLIEKSNREAKNHNGEDGNGRADAISDRVVLEESRETLQAVNPQRQDSQADQPQTSEVRGACPTVESVALPICAFDSECTNSPVEGSRFCYRHVEEALCN